jgi:N6-adenosine-specific RNA methylase IME4
VLGDEQGAREGESSAQAGGGSVTLYATTLLDPPWLESGSGRIKRGADRHYPLLSRPEILSTVTRSGMFTPAKNAHMYLWVTNNHLPDGLWLMDALGFEYKTCITWAKSRPGLGRYFRGKTEHLLFGVRGRGMEVRTDDNGITTLITEPFTGKRVHSRKPDEAYRVIERRSQGPFVELFARQRRAGWDAWGNELEVAA